MKGLLMEQFPEDPKGKKEASFKTDRPFVWYKSLHQYVMDNSLATRCEIKRQKKNTKVSMIKVFLSFGDGKDVTLIIKFVNGIFAVNGRLAGEWVKQEYGKLKVTTICDHNTGEDDTSESVQEKTTPLDPKEITEEIMFTSRNHKKNQIYHTQSQKSQ